MEKNLCDTCANNDPGERAVRKVECKYTLDEVNAVLDVAEMVEKLLKRIDTMPELKATIVCPHCRCYDKDVMDKVMLHGIPCGVSCMRGLAEWIKEEADMRLKAFYDSQQDDAPRAAAVRPDDWHMCGPGEQLR